MPPEKSGVGSTGEGLNGLNLFFLFLAFNIFFFFSSKFNLNFFNPWAGFLSRDLKNLRALEALDLFLLGGGGGGGGFADCRELEICGTGLS